MKKRYKTKFPVARIKKIMQKDEEVGKVAQVAPVLISKALELFMQNLIDETCMITKENNAKKMSAAHLKRCIMTTPMFDFLRDAVENVPDPKEPTTSAPPENPGKGRRKSSNVDKLSDSDDTTGKTKRKRKGRKRVKVEQDEIKVEEEPSHPSSSPPDD